jgi:diaminohydroxyphosphoribosylaminopyrimidine deaminase/5-amino-6-(5-phosphoribosylamino)uracil reductase
VLTGIDTVLSDDPQLNVRDPAIDLLGRQPLRVALDTRLRMPASAKLLQSPGETLVISGAAAEAGSRIGELRSAGAEVLTAPLDEQGHVDLHFVVQELGRRMCNDVLVEAGPTLTGRVLQLGLADELIVYMAPLLLGPDAKPMAQLSPLQHLTDAQRYKLHSTDRIGDDVKLVLRPVTSQ